MGVDVGGGRWGSESGGAAALLSAGGNCGGCGGGMGDGRGGRG